MTNAETSDEPQIRLELLSQPRFLAGVRAMLACLAQRLGFNEIQCGQISLAVDEALCNVITHGYDRRPDGRVWMSIFALEGKPPALKVVIEDLARQVDPDVIRPRDLDDIRPGGLGVHIIREVMDQVEYERRDGSKGMRLTMVKRMSEPGAAPATASPESVQERMQP